MGINDKKEFNRMLFESMEDFTEYQLNKEINEYKEKLEKAEEKFAVYKQIKKSYIEFLKWYDELDNDRKRFYKSLKNVYVTVLERFYDEYE